MGKASQLLGKTFTYLTVIERLENSKNHQTRWKVQCKCGTVKCIAGRALTRGNTKSCGCLQKEKVSQLMALPEGEAPVNDLFRHYKASAKSREIFWNLTKEECIDFFKANCHYCGTKPYNRYRKDRYRFEFFYNGIDRLDSTKGYTLDNTTACCGRCNKAKSIMGYDEFIDWIRLVYNNLFKDLKC